LSSSDDRKPIDESEATERKLRDEIEILKRKLLEAEQRSRDDRLKLAIIDKSPFTIWAADRDCKIRLWTPSAARVYGRSSVDAIGKDFVKLFLDHVEAADARKDCRHIIDDDAVFPNFLASDHTANGQRKMLTNCFRVQDPTSGDLLQAEVGIDISDLPEREMKHRTLRELGAAMAAQEKMTLDLGRENLRFFLERARDQRIAPVNAQIKELEAYFERADANYKREHAERIRLHEAPKLRALQEKRKAIDRGFEILVESIKRVDAVDNIEPLREQIKEFGDDE